MNEAEALARMVPPSQRRDVWSGGVLQIHVTRACDKACFGCTQGSQLAGKPTFMSPEHFEQAVLSLDGYFGVVGVFGGNPALSPHFEAYCAILAKHVPWERRGLWCNHPKGKGAIMRRTFNPGFSNINVHLDREAYDEFRRDWPECHPFDLDSDSRHAPPYVAMKDVVADEAQRWNLISGCDINRRWSAMIADFRGQLRAWFCEIAGGQSILHQDDPDYPDTGLDPTIIYTTKTPGQPVFQGEALKWWQLPMQGYASQVRKHCHDCGIPLRGYGELACAEDGTEHVSATHAGVFRPKRPGRKVEVVTTLEQIGVGKLHLVTDYIGNAKR